MAQPPIEPEFPFDDPNQAEDEDDHGTGLDFTDRIHGYEEVEMDDETVRALTLPDLLEISKRWCLVQYVGTSDEHQHYEEAVYQGSIEVL